MKDGKKCILIADDDRQIRQILALLLASQEHAVVTAADGMEAEAQAGPDIDLYILDVNMPGQSGLMAAAAIRRRFETPSFSLRPIPASPTRSWAFPWERTIISSSPSPTRSC